MAFSTQNLREQSGIKTDLWIHFLLALAGLVPHLLVALQMEFAAMLSLYLCFPASMGLLTLLHVHIMRSCTGFLSPLGWLSALFLSLLWLGLVRWVWLQHKGVAVVVYGLGLALPAALLWFQIMSPT